MQGNTPQGVYFHGTTKELHLFLINLSKYYSTINQLIHKKTITLN